MYSRLLFDSTGTWDAIRGALHLLTEKVIWRIFALLALEFVILNTSGTVTDEKLI